MLVDRVNRIVPPARRIAFVAAMALLPFSEWRTIEYDFLGPRSFSVFHIVFIVFMGLLCLDGKRLLDVGREQWVRLSILLCPLLGTLVHLVLVPPDGTMVKAHSFAMSVLFAIGTLAGLMVIDYRKMIKWLFVYVCTMLSLLMIPTVLLMTGLHSRWVNEIREIFTLSYMHVGTPCFFAGLPFIHPNHASFVMLACLFLLMGILLSVMGPLSLRKTVYGLLSAVAATELAIALLGSRTGAGLFAMLLPAFFGGLLVSSLFYHEWQRRDGVLLAAAGMGGYVIGAMIVVYVVSFTRMGIICVQRILSMLDYGITDILTGRADVARRVLWGAAIPELFGYEGAGVLSGDENLHSVLIDLYVWAGPLAAAFFVIFLIALSGLGLRRVYQSWGTAFFPIYWGALMVTMVVGAFMYFQPVEYFAPVWVSIGLVIRLLLAEPDSQEVST